MVAAVLWKFSLFTRNLTMGLTNTAMPYANTKGHTKGNIYLRVIYEAINKPPTSINVVIFFLVVLVITAPPHFIILPL